MRALRKLPARVIVSALLIGSTRLAGAQLANASTAATGLSGAFTARATGYNAVFWNPANLAMPGNPGFSLTFLGFDASAGLKPLDLSTFAPYSGKTVPKAVREQWLTDITAQGGEKGDLGGGLTEVAFSLGSFAFQANTKFSASTNLAPDAMELLMFGNAGRTGTYRTFNLAGASLQGSAYSTGAISYAMPVGLIPLANLAIGATAKFTRGHGLVAAFDDGSTIGDSITLKFPTVVPDSTNSSTANIGNGVGLDLGAAWTVPGFRFGVNLQNVVNTFKWDTTKLAVRDFSGVLSASSNQKPKLDSLDQPYSSAPAALRAKVAALKFKPVLSAGVSFDWMPKMTVSADVRQQAGDGIEVGPQSYFGAGVELKLIPFIPLRGGVSVMTGGYGFSGGVGIHFLGYELGAAGFLRKRDGGSEPGFTLNLVSIRP